MNVYRNPYQAASRPVALKIAWIDRSESAAPLSSLGRLERLAAGRIDDIGLASEQLAPIQHRITACRSLIDGATLDSDFVQVAAAREELIVLERHATRLSGRLEAAKEASRAARDTADRCWNDFVRLRRQILWDAERGLEPSDEQRRELAKLTGTIIP